MKNNWMQLITICLCIALLATVIVQGRQIEAYQQEMKHRLSNLTDSLSREIQYITDDVRRELEEAGRVVEDYGIEVIGLDHENRSLEAEISLRLKRWYEDTEVQLLMTVGEELVNVYPGPEGGGTWSAIVNLPLEGDCYIEAEAIISGGGMTTGERLEAWGNIAMLLPLYQSGGGWSAAEYRDGVMYWDFYIGVGNMDGTFAPVYQPEFRTYRNGQLVHTLPANPYPYGGEMSGEYAPNRDWSVACGPGDVIELRFRCVDEFGLGYDFAFQNWLVEEETGEITEGFFSDTDSPELTFFWPE